MHQTAQLIIYFHSIECSPFTLKICFYSYHYLVSDCRVGISLHCGAAKVNDTCRSGGILLFIARVARFAGSRATGTLLFPARASSCSPVATRASRSITCALLCVACQSRATARTTSLSFNCNCWYTCFHARTHK